MTLSPADFTAREPDRPLAVSAAFDPTRSFLFEGLAPRYATRVVHSQFIAMRDGVRLSTDFHLPLGAQLPLPVVLIRTCYGKTTSRAALQTLLPEQGFVLAVQDVRGRYESEGEFVACTGRDREDGYDTVEWLAAQPWCNGAIGALGSSYLGETAAKLAAVRHPRHRCSVIMFDGSYAGGNSRNGAYLQGGVTMLRMMFEWFRNYVPKVSYGPPPWVDRSDWFQQEFARAYATQPVAQRPIVDLAAHLRTLPVYDLLDRSGAVPSDFAEMMRRAANLADPYWSEQGFLTDQDHFDSPTLHVTGPLERGGSGFDNFRLMRENALSERSREHQYLLFTPAEHSQIQLCGEDTWVGARHFGDTRFPYFRTIVEWFGHWLRREPEVLPHWPKVRYFLANRNEWCASSTWPPETAERRQLYLRSGGHANGRDGDGVLSWTAPPDAEPPDGFTYDPGDPVPSEPSAASLDALGGSYADRGSIESRTDVLVYTTPPLVEPVVLAGEVCADLFISSSAPDTDFALVLCEVDAQGRSVNLTHGIARARYREGFSRPTLMQAGEVYRITVDLWHVAVEVAAGSCLRLAVSSSHFPAFDRNLNTGGDNYTDTHWIVARNRVHHQHGRASCLHLTVLPTGLKRSSA